MCIAKKYHLYCVSLLQYYECCVPIMGTYVLYLLYLLNSIYFLDFAFIGTACYKPYICSV